VEYEADILISSFIKGTAGRWSRRQIFLYPPSLKGLQVGGIGGRYSYILLH